ncbi:MAG: ABC transporter ATP-binding protein [Lachnospiraceae bacterium]
MIIEMKNCVKKYGSGENIVYALHGVDLEIEEREICVILGPSGSGKSTLLNVIGGLDFVDSGTVIIQGNDLSHTTIKELSNYRRAGIGFVFQSYNLISDLTAKENIESVLDIADNPLDFEEVIFALGINPFMDRFPNELSGGQQQRVAIARAMIKNPKLLLCDELTGALDTESSKEILSYVETLNQTFNTTVLIITHNEAIKEMADRVVCIKDGKIISNTKCMNKKPAEELIL